MRRYRYQHLRSQSDVPMSPMNADRHGLANLKKEAPKALDKFYVPPSIVFIMLGFTLAGIAVAIQEQEEVDFEKLARTNLLLAMKKQQIKLDYDTETEITPTEELEMKTRQFEQVRAQQKRDAAKLKNIKTQMLGGGFKQEPVVDIEAVQ